MNAVRHGQRVDGRQARFGVWTEDKGFRRTRRNPAPSPYLYDRIETEYGTANDDYVRIDTYYANYGGVMTTVWTFYIWEDDDGHVSG